MAGTDSDGGGGGPRPADLAGLVRHDLGRPGDLRSGALDFSMVEAPDLSSLASPDLLAASSAPDLAAHQTGNCRLVVNEVQTGSIMGGTADEFVELYNTCPASTGDLGGWKVVYRSAAGTTDVSEFNFPTGIAIGKNGFFVLGGAAFVGPRDTLLNAGLKADGGAVGVRDAAGKLVDGVGWGTAMNALVEGAAADAPTDSAPARSIVRIPDGADGENNAVDFQITRKPTPHAPNVVL